MNYPDLPRSGLPGPRLLRSELPVSASELVSDVDTAVPDSAGDFPSRAVRSVPLLPLGHSATIAGARFLSRLNAGGGVASIVLLPSTAGVVNVAETVFANRAGAVSPPYSAPSGRSVEEGELAPSPQKLIRIGATVLVDSYRYISSQHIDRGVFQSGDNRRTHRWRGVSYPRVNSWACRWTPTLRAPT